MGRTRSFIGWAFFFCPSGYLDPLGVGCLTRHSNQGVVSLAVQQGCATLIA